MSCPHVDGPYYVGFGNILALFVLAENGDVGEQITRIYRLAEKVDARLANLFCAYSIPNRSHALTSPRSGHGFNDWSPPAVRSEEQIPQPA